MDMEYTVSRPIICERCHMRSGSTSEGVCGDCYTRESGTYIRSDVVWCRSCSVPSTSFRVNDEKVCQSCEMWARRPKRLWRWYSLLNAIRGWQDYHDEGWRKSTW